ncbi:uncharacterized protein ACIB01_008596 [Guaruba guarouba]
MVGHGWERLSFGCALGNVPIAAWGGMEPPPGAAASVCPCGFMAPGCFHPLGPCSPRAGAYRWHKRDEFEVLRSDPRGRHFPPTSITSPTARCLRCSVPFPRVPLTLSSAGRDEVRRKESSGAITALLCAPQLLPGDRSKTAALGIPVLVVAEEEHGRRHRL